MESAYRQGVNFLIQGTAADVFKISIRRVNDLLKGMKSRVVIPIHDELIFYMHKDEIFLLPKIKAEMERFDFKVPLIAEVSWSPESWAEKRSLN